MTSFGATNTGRQHTTNEDQFAVAVLTRALWIEHASLPHASVRYGEERGHVFIVADGLGGARGGDRASALAVGTVESSLLNTLSWLLSVESTADDAALRAFQDAIRDADARVCKAATNDPGLRGMGTTLTLAYSVDSAMFVVHAGDSRCYLLREGALGRLTRDDTLVQDMVESGLLEATDAPHHYLRHVVTNVVGGNEPGVQIQVRRSTLEAGDTVLLCTDGLTTMLTDDDIRSVLTRESDPERACMDLIQLANERDGADDVTVVVARYDQLPA